MDKQKLIEWLKRKMKETSHARWLDSEKFAQGIHDTASDLLFEINNGAFDKEPCEFCSNDLNQGFHQDFETLSCRFFVSGDFEKVIVKCNFCPSCGRALSTNKHQQT